MEPDTDQAATPFDADERALGMGGEITRRDFVGSTASGTEGTAYFLHKLAGHDKTCVFLDNHPIPGGEAERNEFMMHGQRLVGPEGTNDTDPAGSDRGWRGDMWRDLRVPKATGARNRPSLSQGALTK